MSDFIKFRNEVISQFESMTKSSKILLVANTDPHKMEDVYLESFPEEDGVRQSFNCNACKSFLRQWGNLVVVNDKFQLVTLWDFTPSNDTYANVTKNLSSYVKSCSIDGVATLTDKRVGLEKNRCTLESGEVIYWNHFYLDIPSKFICSSSKSSNLTSSINVFDRSLKKISIESLDTVIELIDQGSLYRGDQYLDQLKTLRRYIGYYNSLKSEDEKSLYAYSIACSSGVNDSFMKLRNTAIGTLLVDINNGSDLESAVRSFESKVAPSNYRRPTALVTKSMIDRAKKDITELGYLDSLPRRHASIQDITVNNVIYVNRDALKSMKGMTDDIFYRMKLKSSVSDKNLNKIETVSISDFINKIVPTCSDIEILFENKNISNLMTLTAPVNSDSKCMFKWNNGFSWSYSGDVADSFKEKVKAAGGNTDAEVRCSLHWFNYDDLDLHMRENLYNGRNTEIFFGNKVSILTRGTLDVDMNAGSGVTRDAVENIFYNNISQMKDGEYDLYVHNYSKRESIDVGFEVEIEIKGDLHKFKYDKEVSGSIPVAKLKVNHGNIELIKSDKVSLSSSSTKSIEKWGLNTQNYHKVSMIMYSPNYWDDNKVGNKHYFFIIDGCKNPDPVRGYYNEYLKDELVRDHKRVFELMGSMSKANYSDDQLSGIGISSTIHDSLIFKITGSFTRKIKVEF